MACRNRFLMSLVRCPARQWGARPSHGPRYATALPTPPRRAPACTRCSTRTREQRHECLLLNGLDLYPQPLVRRQRGESCLPDGEARGQASAWPSVLWIWSVPVGRIFLPLTDDPTQRQVAPKVLHTLLGNRLDAPKPASLAPANATPVACRSSMPGTCTPGCRPRCRSRREEREPGPEAAGHLTLRR